MGNIKMVDFKKIEQKWQKEWEKAKIFEVKEDSKKRKYYVLEMFAYPSSTGLHIGHAFNYVIGDIFARFKIMQGFNVLHPMGYDSLGLPAENAAIKEKVHPKKYTEEAIKNFIKQQQKLGLSYDWARMVVTHNPEYYKWDQWIFLKMFEKGIAFKKKSAVNFCKKCDTVLANEQVHDGKCWRHKDTDVEIKQLEQWFFKITDYAEELYDDIEKLKEWPEDVKIMQKNWIGKSHGAEINFRINDKEWPVFTTRPDTIYGVTFMVVSAQHSRLMEIVSEEQRNEVEEFLKNLKSTSEKEAEGLEKEGIFTGSYAVNPLTNERVPVYAGNFVLADYGSGMVMAVPAHDQRDWEFAKKYKIPIKEVIKGGNIKEKAFTEDGILINSNKFSGLNSSEAIEEITKFLESKNLGKKSVNYKLKDWLISRQRYWGTPIPVVYCEKCGIVLVPEKELPVLLPKNVNFGKGNPLTTSKDFVETKCPKCKGKARRETDTMDTFVNSSWYFLRYCDSENKKEIFDKKKVKYWMPIDLYIGGKEHACMHLIYFRFYTKFLRDLGLLNIDEPSFSLFNQGMVHGEDGVVMSKSRGNVVNPLDIIEKYGADILRLYLISNAGADKDFTWSSEAIEGSLKFVNKVFNYFGNVKSGKSDERVTSKYNKLVNDATEDIEKLRYNFAIIKLREFFDCLGDKESKNVLEGFLKLFSVFCPHITEEIWHELGNRGFISLEKWPKADEKKINPEFEKQDIATERLIEDINNIIKILREKQNKSVERVYIYALPKEKEIYDNDLIKKKLNLEIEIFSVADKGKYDPQGKAGRAKPGKPAVYAE